MSNNEIFSDPVGRVSIKSLIENKLSFIIPTYQRGYRWRDDNVQALLDDLTNFADDRSQQKYCLQPLVIKKTENGFRVIDGQQRLTTLWLILKAWTENTGNVIWSIDYDKLNEETIWMNNISSKSAVATLNQELKKRAYDLASSTPKNIQENIFCKREHIEFIYYKIEDGDEIAEKSAFRRLNSGKIPLTASELIKALFLVSNNGLSDEERMEVAKEWELIEVKLHDDSFWYMLSHKEWRTATRMDLLFSIATMCENNDDFLAPYLEIEKETRNDPQKLRKMWETILCIFWLFESCYNDIEIYHYLGWVKHFTNNQWKTLIFNDKCYLKTSLDLKFGLKTIIRKKLSGWEKYNYGTTKRDLRSLFVFFNIESVNIIARHNNGESFERFPWNLYANMDWDIEHIDSNTPNALTNPETRKAWIDACKDIIRDEKELLKEISEYNCSITEEKFKNIFDKIIKYFGININEDDDKNSIGNLTLLDSKTNREYHNDIFPIKRQKIIDNIENGSFVPLCTQRVFMKYYTKTVSGMMNWSKEIDKKAYLEAMRKIWNNNFAEENRK